MAERDVVLPVGAMLVCPCEYVNRRRKWIVDRTSGKRRGDSTMFVF